MKRNTEYYLCKKVDLHFSTQYVFFDKSYQRGLSFILNSDKQLDTLYEDASLGISLKIGCSLIATQNKWNLIILDETLSGVDEPNRNTIIKYLENIVDAVDTTVLIVSHNNIEKSIKSNHEIINL